MKRLEHHKPTFIRKICSKQFDKLQQKLSHASHTIKPIQKDIGVVNDMEEFGSSISLIESSITSPDDNLSDSRTKHDRFEKLPTCLFKSHTFASSSFSVFETTTSKASSTPFNTIVIDDDNEKGIIVF